MNPVDIAIAALCAWFAVAGVLHGLVRQLFSIGGILAGHLLGIQFYPAAQKALNLSFPRSEVAGYAVIFLAVCVAVRLIGGLLEGRVGRAELPTRTFRPAPDSNPMVLVGAYVELSNLLRHEVDWIVMKALEKDRARRYETANDLAGDLERHLEHQPVVAGPPSTLYRARKFIRRHRVGVVLSATAVGALLVGLSAAAVGFVHAWQERDRALTAEHQARQERDRAVTAEQQTEQERDHAELLAAEAALVAGQSKLGAGDSSPTICR